MRNSARFLAICLGIALMPPVYASASKIETQILESPWPGERTKILEVGAQNVVWKHWAEKNGTIFAQVDFTAPDSLKAVWEKATDIQGLAQLAPSVRSVRILQEEGNYQKIELVLKVLWINVVLVYEIEKDPLDAARFRLTSDGLGGHRGLARFEQIGPDKTRVILSLCYQPEKKISPKFVMTVHRIAMLQGVKGFLKSL